MTTNLDTSLELRKKLLRRLIWKAPLITILVTFAVWWQWRQDAERKAFDPLSSAAAFAGRWRGEITYGPDKTFSEEFFFRVDGATASGTATLFGTKRPIEEVQVVGEILIFKVRTEAMAGATARPSIRYEVKRGGGEIILRLFDDQKNAPLEVRLIPVKTPGDDGLKSLTDGSNFA